MPTSSGYYTSCPQFFINASSGDDGRRTPDDTSRAWKTVRRLRDAVGQGNLFRGDRAVTVTVETSLPSSDPLFVDYGINDPTFANVLTFVFPKTTIGSTATVQTPRARKTGVGNNDANGITTTSGGSFNWTPFKATDMVLFGTSGNIDGAVAHVMLDEGSGVGRVSVPWLTSTATEKVIAASDTFVRQQLSRVDKAIVRPPVGLVRTVGAVITKPVAVSSPISGAASVSFRECSIEASSTYQNTQVSFANCRMEGIQSMQASRPLITAGLGSNLLGASQINFGSGTYVAADRWSGQYSSLVGDFSGALMDVIEAGLYGDTIASIGSTISVGRFANLYLRILYGNCGPASAVILDPGSSCILRVGGTFTATGSNGDVNMRNAQDHNSNSGASWAQAIKGLYNWMGTSANIGPQT